MGLVEIVEVELGVDVMLSCLTVSCLVVSCATAISDIINAIPNVTKINFFNFRLLAEGQRDDTEHFLTQEPLK